MGGKVCELANAGAGEPGEHWGTFARAGSRTGSFERATSEWFPGMPERGI